MKLAFQHQRIGGVVKKIPHALAERALLSAVVCVCLGILLALIGAYIVRISFAQSGGEPLPAGQVSEQAFNEVVEEWNRQEQNRQNLTPKAIKDIFNP